MSTVLAMIEIDLHSPVPSYRQLADILRGRIESGELGPRDALPSITFLVQETGLAVNTVRHAIRVLVDEGCVYVIPGRGTYVAPASERPK